MFLKFGQKKDIEDLYYNGTIYMSPIQSFREIEDNQLRGDLYEGISSITNYPSGQFEIPSINYKGNYIAIHLKKSYPTVLGNIYSLYCVSSHGWSNPLDFKIDQRVKNFGSHCLMVKDNQKFMGLIEAKLIQLNIKFHHGFVEYYDKKAVTKEISLFEKPLEFEYQKEFRFYVERDSTEPFSFQIGSLAGIAEIYPSKIVVDELALTVNEQMQTIS